MAAGWAKPRAGREDAQPELAELAAAAEAAGDGLWTQDPEQIAAAVRHVTDGVEDAMGVKERAAGAELDAIVEYIMDAGRCVAFSTSQPAARYASDVYNLRF